MGFEDVVSWLFGEIASMVNLYLVVQTSQHCDAEKESKQVRSLSVKRKNDRKEVVERVGVPLHP
jgi:hypothetical protein